MIYDKFRAERGRVPSAKEREQLAAQMDNILGQYEEALGLRPPVEMVIQNLDVQNPNMRYSGQGNDWSMYLDRRALVDLGRAAERAQPLAAVYRAVLGREPDADGLAFWQGQYDDGMPLSDVIRYIEQSPEAQVG